MLVCSTEFSPSFMANSLGPHGLYLALLLCPWDFPAKNTGVGCHFLLQGIFLTRGSKPTSPAWQADSLPLSHQGSPNKGLSSEAMVFPVVMYGCESWTVKKTEHRRIDAFEL